MRRASRGTSARCGNAWLRRKARQRSPRSARSSRPGPTRVRSSMCMRRDEAIDAERDGCVLICRPAWSERDSRALMLLLTTRRWAMPPFDRPRDEPQHLGRVARSRASRLLETWSQAREVSPRSGVMRARGVFAAATMRTASKSVSAATFSRSRSHRPSVRDVLVEVEGREHDNLGERLPLHVTRRVASIPSVTAASVSVPRRRRRTGPEDDRPPPMRRARARARGGAFVSRFEPSQA